MSNNTTPKSSPEPRTGTGIDAANLVRSRIIGGQYHPGERLPAQRDLAVEIGVSFVTVQRALDSLRRDGFVEPRGPLGTFVSATPPHLSRMAMVFHTGPYVIEHYWSRFYQALVAAAQSPIGETQVKPYFNIGINADGEDTLRLTHDIARKRIGGVIFASAPHVFLGSALLEEPGIHRVSISSPNPLLTFPSVYPDRIAFFERAVKHLASMGRRRPAILWGANGTDAPFDDRSLREISSFESAASNAGMTLRPWWIQGVSTVSPGWAQNCVRLLFHPEQAERPDSLIIADDNLVEHATAGLLSAGVSVPRDVHVVGFANFPCPPRAATAATLLGFDARRILQLCLERLSDQRNGHPTTGGTFLPPMLESEI